MKRRYPGLFAMQLPEFRSKQAKRGNIYYLYLQPAIFTDVIGTHNKTLTGYP